MRKFTVLFAAILLTAVFAAASFAQDTGKITLGVKSSPPFSMKDGNGEWTGISMDLWKHVAEGMNVEYEIKEYDLAGLLKAVETGEVDAGVAALTITSERELVMDFSQPFYTSGLGIAVSSSGSGLLGTLKSFFSMSFFKAVGVLIAVIVVFGVLIWIFEKNGNPEEFGGNAAQGLFSGFWWSAVTMTTVGYGDKSPKTFGGRMVALVWMFTAIIIISGLTAAIASSLTVNSLSSHIQGVEDLYRARVGTTPGSTSAIFLEGKGISYKKYDSVDEAMKALDAGTIEAVVYDAPILRYIVKNDYKGKLMVLGKKFQEQYYGIALPAGSENREKINRQVLEYMKTPEWHEMITGYLGE